MPRTVLTRHLAGTFQLRRGGPVLWPATRALLSMLVPLLVLLQLDRLDLVAGAVFGALTSVHARAEPYRQQARTLAVVAVGMVLAVAIGDLIAIHGAEPVALIGTAVVGAVSTAIATAVKIGPPGGLIFAFATGACAHLALDPADLGPHLTVTAISAAFAWTVSTVGAVLDGLGPQRRSVGAAFEATADHLAHGDLGTRHRAAVAVEAAWHAVALVGWRHRETPAHLDLVRAVETCESLLTEPGMTESEVRIAAREVRRGRSFLEAATPSVPPVPESRWRLIRAVLQPHHHLGSWVLPHAVRVAVAALAAGTTADLLGIGHAYWAAVSAVSVLQATSASTSVPRMIQRVTGTVLGVLIGLAALAVHPEPWLLIILLAVLQWAAEMTVMANYAIGLFFATPVALLVSALGSPAAPAELASNRFWATLLGAAIAVAVAWVAPRGAWLRRLDTALARVRELSAERPPRPGTLRSALVELHEAYDLAAGEARSAELPTEELLDASHHGYRVLDRPSGHTCSSGLAPG